MKLAIYGYGNLGKSAEAGVPYFPDIELTGIFTRREPSSVESHGTPVYNAQDILLHKDHISHLKLILSNLQRNFLWIKKSI